MIASLGYHSSPQLDNSELTYASKDFDITIESGCRIILCPRLSMAIGKFPSNLKGMNDYNFLTRTIASSTKRTAGRSSHDDLKKSL